MLQDELQSLIANLRCFGTEHAQVEAKAASGPVLPKSLRETVSAFAPIPSGASSCWALMSVRDLPPPGSSIRKTTRRSRLHVPRNGARDPARAAVV